MARRSVSSAQCLKELQALLADLRDITPTQDGPYTFRQEYEDFRLTFGTTHGSRVFSLINAICTPQPILPGMSNSDQLWFNEGLRWAFSQFLLRLSGERVRKQEEPEPDYDPRDQY